MLDSKVKINYLKRLNAYIAYKIRLIADKMAKWEYIFVHMKQTIKTITNRSSSSRIRPDIAGVGGAAFGAAVGEAASGTTLEVIDEERSR